MASLVVMPKAVDIDNRVLYASIVASVRVRPKTAAVEVISVSRIQGKPVAIQARDGQEMCKSPLLIRPPP